MDRGEGKVKSSACLFPKKKKKKKYMEISLYSEGVDREVEQSKTQAGGKGSPLCL